MSSTTSRFSSKVGAIATAVSLVLGIGTAQATAVTLTAVADALVLDGSNLTNLFPGILASELGTNGAGSVFLSLLKFDLSAVVGMQINSASLELTTNFNHSSSTFSHQMYSSSDDSWAETSVNGINRPANSTLSLLSAASINGVSRPYLWNVLSGVTGSDGLGGSGAVITFLIRPDLSQTGVAFGPHFNDRSVSSGFPRLLLGFVNK
jgi:hypothetical protein